MASPQASLVLFLALLCVSCNDRGEFSDSISPAHKRQAVSYTAGSFAGELYSETHEPPPPIVKKTEPPVVKDPEPVVVEEKTISPIAPAFYLAPSEDIDISVKYYAPYGSVNKSLHAEDWYDTQLPYYQNRAHLIDINSTAPEKAVSIFNTYKNHADAGDPICMLLTGCLYYMGIGTKESAEMAMLYFNKAAAQQHSKYARQLAYFNIRYVQLTSDEVSFADCLEAIEADAKKGINVTTEYGELLYLLWSNKVRSKPDSDANCKLILQSLAQFAVQDKTGSCDYVSALNYRNGNMGVSQNDENALRLYKKAADFNNSKKGYPRAHLALANIYHFGKLGQTLDYSKSLEAYTRAAILDENCGLDACNYRARAALAVNRLLQGKKNASIQIPASTQNQAPESHSPLALLEKAASEGDSTAQYNLGIYRLKEAKGKMTPGILNLISDGVYSDQLNIRSCAAIYKALYSDNKDESNATEENIRVLETIPHAAAKTLLANCYVIGIGVERDMKKAASLYEENQYEDPAARYNLALCYENGVGVTQDQQKAKDLKEQAESELAENALH